MFEKIKGGDIVEVAVRERQGFSAKIAGQDATVGAEAIIDVDTEKLVGAEGVARGLAAPEVKGPCRSGA